MKKKNNFPLYFILAIMIFSPFTAFLFSGSTSINVNVEIRTGILSGNQQGKITVEKGSSVRDALANLGGNFTGERIDCIGNRCGDWKVYLNGQEVVFLDKELSGDDSLIITYQQV